MKVLIAITDTNNTVSIPVLFEFPSMTTIMKGDFIDKNLLSGLPVKEDKFYFVSFRTWTKYENNMTLLLNVTEN